MASSVGNTSIITWDWDQVKETISWDQLQEKEVLETNFNGAIYRAKWGEKEVVIKTFCSFDPQGHIHKASFHQEIRVMDMCRQCPQIIQLLGITSPKDRFTGATVGCAYVMEYIRRGALNKILEDQSQVLEWPAKYQIAVQTAQGLAYLHGLTILHGDIKSPNILIDDRGGIKICDFSFSTVGENIIHEGYSLRWVQPERVTNRRSVVYTEACDIFSYGLVMWEIATRKLPHPNEKTVKDLEQKMRNKVHDPLPEDCPAEYAKWVECCRAFDPKDRPSAKAVNEALEQALPKEGNVS
jgi:protein kinase domain-containing protein